MPKKSPLLSRRVTIAGKTHPASHWMAKNDLNYQQVFHRLRRGWSLRRAVTEPIQGLAPDDPRLERVTVGKRTKTIRQWARSYGVSRQLLAARLGRGWSAERAATTPPKRPGARKRPAPSRARKLRNEPFVIDGVSKTPTQWGRIFGLSRQAIGRRIDSGWPVLLALTTAPKAQRGAFEKRALKLGRRTRPIEAWCEDRGFGTLLVRWRRKKGMTLEEAVRKRAS